MIRSSISITISASALQLDTMAATLLLAATLSFSLSRAPVRPAPRARHESPQMVAPLVGALAADVAAASIAAVGCAPVVACVDQAITLSASGQAELWPTLGAKLKEIGEKPVQFFKSPAFLWLWFNYALTYAAANCALTISRALGVSPVLPVLVCSTAANTGASLAKDAAFAKMLSSGPPKAVPAGAYAAWLGRDATTMAFTFTVPGLLAGKVSDLLCRLSAPVIAQYFTSPFHLLGLAFYNKPTAKFGEKLSTALAPKTLVPTVFARQFRIIPAFSLGGVANAKLKVMLLQNLVGA